MSSRFGHAPAICDFPVMPHKARSVGEKVIVNRTATGNPSGRQTRRAILYIDRQFDMSTKYDVSRGQWYGPAGVMTMNEAEAYGIAQAKEHEFTFHLVLSVRDGDPTDAQFVDAVQQLGEYIESYQLLVHRDTAHTHAHILWYRDSLTTRDEYEAVKGGLIDAIKEHELDAIRDDRLSYGGRQRWHEERLMELENEYDLDVGREM